MKKSSPFNEGAKLVMEDPRGAKFVTSGNRSGESILKFKDFLPLDSTADAINEEFDVKSTETRFCRFGFITQ